MRKASLELCVTEQCNLSCKHCYQGKKRKVHSTIPYKKVMETVRGAKELGFSAVTFTGGEFFTHPEWKEILEATPLNYTVITNGTLISDKTIRILKSTGVDKVIVSIDGFKEHHDSRRGPGTFNKAFLAIEKMRQAGIPVDANVTIDNNNSRYIDKLHNFLRDKGVNKIVYLSLGCAGNFLDNSVLNYDDFTKKLVLKVYRTFSVSRPRYQCDIFYNILSVDYFGDVYPCIIARDYKVMRLGNIYNKPIKKIYLDIIKKNEMPFLHFNKHKLQCSACAHFEECKGRCRIRAYKLHNNFYAKDDFACAVYKNEYNKDINKLMWGLKDGSNV